MSDRKYSDRRYQQKLRGEFIAAYDGQCACGQNDPLVLTVGHTRGDGRAHRKRVGIGGANVLMDLRRRGWPKDEGIVVQCGNCQLRARRTGFDHIKGVP